MKTLSLNPPTSKTKRFLFVLPLISIPFLTLIFWLMGGGDGSSLMAKTSEDSHLLTTLPAVDLSAQKGLDKMSYYEKATADSLKNDGQARKSAFWDETYFQAGEKESLAGTEFNNPYDPQLQEKALYEKLDQLNEVLTSSEKTPSSSMNQQSHHEDKHLIRAQKNLGDLGNNTDPELEQLNGMLEKIWQIQHPEANKASDPEAHLENLYRAIPALIEGKQKVGQGAVVKLRLLEPVELNHQLIPKGHLIYGTSSIMNQRLKLDITSIRLGKSILPVDLSTYDMTDGMEGINVPDALLNDAVRTGSDNAVQSLQLLPFDQNMETQIAGAGISAAKGLFSKRSRRIRVKLKDGYRVLLKNNRK